MSVSDLTPEALIRLFEARAAAPPTEASQLLVSTCNAKRP